MGTAKFKVDKFTGSNDFGLWRLNMRAFLVHQGLENALKGSARLPQTMSDQEKKILMEKAHSAIILSLGVEESIKRKNCSRGLVKAQRAVYDKITSESVVSQASPVYFQNA